MRQLKKLITRVGGGGGLFGGWRTGRERTDALPPRWKKSDLVSFFYLEPRDPNGLF